MKTKYFLVAALILVSALSGLLIAHPASAAATTTFTWDQIYNQTYPGVPPFSQGNLDGSFYGDKATADKVCQLKGFTDSASFVPNSYTSCEDNFLVQWTGSSFVQIQACQSNTQIQTLICETTNNQLRLVSSSAPATVNLGDTFQIKCNFGVTSIGCINSTHAGSNCSYVGFQGNDAVFNCVATKLGLQQNFCDIFSHPIDPRCTPVQNDPIQSTNVLAVCTDHASKKCVDNSVYWFDSCGKQQDLVQTCSANQTCANGACIKQTCTPHWTTGQWGSCNNGQQTRNCHDDNNCGVNDGKPATTQMCGNPPPNNCAWVGHCQGDSCQTFDDCDGNLVCNSGKCGPAGNNPQPSCTPNWQTGSWDTCNNGQQTRTCNDTNNCGINDGKPATIQSCTNPNPPPNNCVWVGHCQGDPCQTFDDCDGNLVCNSGKCGPAGNNPQPSCTPNWQTGQWGSCTNGQQTRTVTDSNSCGVYTGEPATTQSCSNLNPPPNGSTFNQGMVSFTFDDGWTSAYQNAYPLLDQNGIKGTEYIISGAVGDTADGYMTSSQILDLQSRGHEIEDHTKTHPDLTTLNSTQLADEITASKSVLEAMGINPITSFDYPYGTYNTTVENVVKSSGYLGARTSDAGYNQKGDDPYLLKAMTIESTTTVADVEQWISSAIANKTWLILVIHDVDNNGYQYDISPSNLSQVTDYIKQNNVKTVKVSEGLSEMTN